MAMNRSQVMAAVKSKNTKPEMVVRKLVHGMGYRYRLHYAKLPGKPDLVFPSRKKVIFVHGCFWHQHTCPAADKPKSNTSYWLPKLERNRNRDIKNLAALKAAGWDALVLWECELGSSNTLQKIISKFLE